MRRMWVILTAVSMSMGLLAWLPSLLTPEGEHTLYTVACSQGAWTGEKCAGKQVAAERFRFLALKAQGEVLFWTVDGSGPVGKLARCSIENGRNWTCERRVDGAGPVTDAMSRGKARVGPESPFHVVSRFTWLRLRWRV